MLSSIDLQNDYNALYTELRNYLLSLDTVDALANLEIEVYTSFPDKDKLVKCSNKIRSDIREIINEDEELKKAFDKLVADIEKFDPNNCYYRLAK